MGTPVKNVSNPREANCEGNRKSSTKSKGAAGLLNKPGYYYSYRNEDVNLTLEVEKQETETTGNHKVLFQMMQQTEYINQKSLRKQGSVCVLS